MLLSGRSRVRSVSPERSLEKETSREASPRGGWWRAAGLDAWLIPAPNATASSRDAVSVGTSACAGVSTGRSLRDPTPLLPAAWPTSKEGASEGYDVATVSISKNSSEGTRPSGEDSGAGVSELFRACSMGSSGRPKDHV